MIKSVHNLKAVLIFVLTSFLVIGSVSAESNTKSDPSSLYNRLGGLAPISVVVSDFIDVVVPDTFLNKNPAVQATRAHVPAAYLKYRVTSMVCSATGGLCEYQGKGMKEAHANLNISEPEWDRMVVLFKEVLAKHKVPAKESQELLEIIGSTKADIVVVSSK